MLEIRQISKSYQQKLALHNVSFNLNPGEIFALLGPNGAGKSTLLRILNQILSPDKGHVTFNQELFRNKHLADIGYLPEERGLYKNLTVKEHGVLLGRLRGLSKAEANIQLDYWLVKFDIDSWKSKRIDELSKGMAQKIQFIFSILHQPKVIILDEPFSGFDPLNIELMKREILQFREEGKTVLISTHNMNSVEELADRGMLLHKGKTILEGTITNMRQAYHSDQIVVRFTGNMLGFVNALWTNFEIVESKELPDNRNEAVITGRNGAGMKELMSSMIDAVEIEHISIKFPTMHDVFVKAIAENELKS